MGWRRLNRCCGRGVDRSPGGYANRRPPGMVAAGTGLRSAVEGYASLLVGSEAEHVALFADLAPPVRRLRRGELRRAGFGEGLGLRLVADLADYLPVVRLGAVDLLDVGLGLPGEAVADLRVVGIVTAGDLGGDEAADEEHGEDHQDDDRALGGR